jgi:hypothetical protein
LFFLIKRKVWGVAGAAMKELEGIVRSLEGKKMKKNLKLSLLLGIIMSITLSSTISAQTQTGAIRGIVNDEEQNPLPGCTVIINSPSMMTKDLYVVTGSKGGYRFPALIPGTYELKAQMSGFETIIRPGIVIHINETITINITLKPSILEKEITVTAPSPTVDLKSSNLGQSFNTTYLDLLPNARDIWSIVEDAPAVIMDRTNVGSSGSGSQSAFSAFGGSKYQSSYNIDGINATDMSSLGSSTMYFSYDSFEEVEISTSSHSAETGSPGVSLNIITKSGSNTLHGQAGFYYSDNKWQSENLSSQLKELGITHGNPMDYYLDYSLNLGGPIFKDKLWFWGLRSMQKVHRFVMGFEFEGKPFPEITDLSSWMGKLDWQITKKIRVAGSWIYDQRYKPYSGAGMYTPPDAALKINQLQNAYQGHATAILSDNAFLDFRLGYVNMSVPNSPTDKAILEHWPVRELRDVGPGTDYPNAPYARGYHYSARRYRDDNRDRIQVNGFLDYYKDDFLWGSHEIKTGFQISKFWEKNRLYNYGPLLTFRFGVPYSVQAQNVPVASLFNITNYAAFVQDSYVFKKRLTVNLGLRFETFTTYLPEQSNPASPWPMNYFAEVWQEAAPELPILDAYKQRTFPAKSDITNFKTLSPRISIIYDLFGDGKTALKAGYSRYYWQVSNTIADFANPNGLADPEFPWSDKNGDGMWQQGEETSTPYYQSLPSTVLINPNLKDTRTDELTIGIERELLKDFSLGATFVMRTDRYQIDDIDRSTNFLTDWTKRTFFDNGPDGIPGTSDDGTFSAYEPINEPLYLFYVTNPESDPIYTWPVKPNKYRGVIISAEKRFSNNWQLLASFTSSSSKGNIDNWLQSEASFDDPNQDLFAFGKNFWDRPVILKISGSYQFPLGINMGVSLRHMSGIPYTRFAETPVELNYVGYVDVRVEPRGSERTPSTTLVDARVEKFFTFPRSGFFPGGRLGIILDLFNILNANTTTQVGDLTSDNYGIIQSILAPRILRLGVKYSF